MAAETLVIPYNDVEAREAVFAAPGESPASPSSPRAGNMGVVPPEAGFTQALRGVDRRARVLPRLRRGDDRLPRARGGAGHECVDAAPDLMTFGKVMGGGLPRAAFGGRADVMGRLAPDGPVYQAGTLCGNPVATPPVSPPCGAATTTLRPLGEGRRHRRAAATALVGMPVCRTASSGPAPCSRSTSARARCAPTTTPADQDTAAFGRFFHAMLDAGVYLPPSAFESWFVSGAHDDAAVERVASALPAAAGGDGSGLSTSEVCDNRLMTSSPQAGLAGDPQRTVVHLLRHGEVHNPHRLLYGRMPGYHLSELGRRMAHLAAEHLSDHDVTHLVSSPLERAQETAAPIADAHRLEVALDARVVEAENYFEGLPVAGGRHPEAPRGCLPKMINPFRPSWGEPYDDLVGGCAARSSPRARPPAATRPSSSATRRRSG